MPEDPKVPDRLADWPSHWLPKPIYITMEQAQKMRNEPPRCPFCEAGFLKKPLMPTEDDYKKVLEIYQEAAGAEYKLRWCDSKGDFPGRGFAIDAFNVPVAEQRALLRRVNTVRDRADQLAGGRCIFIFHTPEATKQYYSHLL